MNPQLVDDYHVARHADELAREERDLGYRTERAMHKAEGVRQPVSFQQWMRQAVPPKPSPDEHTAALEGSVRQLQAWMRDAERAYLEACATYRDEIAYMNRQGLSVRRIAKALGVSHQAVHRIITTERG